jgi:hypothetical protein
MKQFGIETRPSPPLRGTLGSDSLEWLRRLELSSGSAPWEVTIALADTVHAPTAHLHLAIESDEWGFRFERGGELSWIRVRGAPMVYLRDDFRLLAETRSLRELPLLVSALEARFSIELRRTQLAVHGELHDPNGAIERWVDRL